MCPAPAVEVPSPNHWTAREVPYLFFFNVASRKFKVTFVLGKLLKSE